MVNSNITATSRPVWSSRSHMQAMQAAANGAIVTPTGGNSATFQSPAAQATSTAANARNAFSQDIADWKAAAVARRAARNAARGTHTGTHHATSTAHTGTHAGTHPAGGTSPGAVTTPSQPTTPIVSSPPVIISPGTNLPIAAGGTGTQLPLPVIAHTGTATFATSTAAGGTVMPRAGGGGRNRGGNGTPTTYGTPAQQNLFQPGANASASSSTSTMIVIGAIAIGAFLLFDRKR